MNTRPKTSMPCDESLLEDLGRAHWAAARLHHVVRDRDGQLDGGLSDRLFDGTLGSAIGALRARADSKNRADIVEWCDQVGTSANEARNGLVHSIAFTAADGKQALRGSRPGRPDRYQSAEILDVADRLIEAGRSIPDV